MFNTRNTHRRLTSHRIRVLAVFWILFIPHQIFTRVCLLLDNLFFPGWRKTPVDKPLFITGLFRSGTTFLHRLMAGDSENLSAMKTWEIYLAPSIIQRKILRVWKYLDRLIGSPAMKWLQNYNTRSLGDIQFHQVGLWKEEEDEGLFLFLWDSLFTWFFFPDNSGIRDYLFADRMMSPVRQRRSMRFYKTCIRRHLYCHPGSPIYLSKNPAFTPRIAGLKEAFPDARVIYMVRDPARVLISQAAWFSFCWHYFASPTENYPFRKELLEMTRHWYSYSLEILKNWDSSDYLIIEYRDLISCPVKSIRRLYTHFGLKMDAGYREWLEKESRRSDVYTSGRNLSPEEVGYEREAMQEKFRDIYKRFGFPISG